MWPHTRPPPLSSPSFHPKGRLACTQPGCTWSAPAAWLSKTSPQPPVLFCFGLFWSTHKTDAFCLFCRPSLFFREAGDGEAAEGRGRLPPAWFPSEAFATARGGPRKKSRKYQRSRLQQNIWSARRSEPRDLCPNAQPAPRLHRRTSFCLREQAVSTLYVPRRGSRSAATCQNQLLVLQIGLCLFLYVFPVFEHLSVLFCSVLLFLASEQR